MSIGRRLRFLRKARGMTQKYLGISIGFPENTAAIRVAQYESETRKPKKETLNGLAGCLNVDPHALLVPDIDSPLGLVHTLFALEDMYGLRIGMLDGEFCLRVAKGMDGNGHPDLDFFSEWYTAFQDYENAKITPEAYHNWRYSYPQISTK